MLNFDEIVRIAMKNKTPLDSKKENEVLREFADEMARQLHALESQFVSVSDLHAFPLIPGKQALYVMNWKENRVSYQRNILELLGYEEEEFTEEIVHARIHPDDMDVVSRVIKGIVKHYIDIQQPGLATFLVMSYRLLKKDNTSIRVMRQSGVFETSKSGKLISNWSVLTDIDFMGKKGPVLWDINGYEVNLDAFREEVYNEFANFFSKRELQIIELIRNKKKSKQIASALNISKHTVDTHRKNILKKANCKSSDQLLAFCRRNGI